MATHNITINEQGTPTPKKIMNRIEPEDYLDFSAGNEPIILCLPVTVFEKERIEIAAGDTAAVRVKANAPHRSFEYWSCNAAKASGLNCSDIRTKKVGDTGGGLSLFPDIGNGGYEVSLYDLTLVLFDDLSGLDGVASITAITTQRLQRFSLDALDLMVASVCVDG